MSNCTVILLLLILTLVNCLDEISQTCQESFDNAWSDLYGYNSAYMTKSFELSGSGLNQFGDPTLCQLQDGYQIGTLIIQGKLLSQIGVCYSTNCTAEEVNLLVKQNVTPAILDQNNVLLDPVKFALGNATSIEFVDPNTNYPKKGFDYYLFFILTAIIAFLSLLKPMVNLIRFAKSSSDEIKITKQPKTQPTRKRMALLNSFSLQKNFNHLLKQVRKTSKSDESDQLHLVSVDFLRLLAYVGTVFGLQYVFAATQCPNPDQVSSFKKTFMASLVASTIYSTDTFLWISGFCLAKQLLGNTAPNGQQAIKSQSLWRWYGLQIQLRILRVYLPYIFAFLIFSAILPQAGGGIRWGGAVVSSKCPNFFASLFLISDLFYEDRVCLLEIWYVPLEFQYFLVASILLYLYVNRPQLIENIIRAIIVIFYIIDLGVSMGLGFKVPIHMEEQQFDQYFVRPWTRGCPYFIGLLVGISYINFQNDSNDILTSKISSLFYKIDKSYSSSSAKTAILIYSAIVGLLLIVILGPLYPQINGVNAWATWFQGFWWATMPLIICMINSLWVSLEVVGHNDTLSKVIEHPLFRLLSRLSFLGSLLSVTVIFGFGFAFPQSYYFQSIRVLLLFVGNFAIISVLSFFLSLLFEMPFLQIRRYAIGTYFGVKHRPSEVPLLGKSDKFE